MSFVLRALNMYIRTLVYLGGMQRRGCAVRERGDHVPWPQRKKRTHVRAEADTSKKGAPKSFGEQ